MIGTADQNESSVEPKELPKRLCSEIQLFDLCELERCRYRDERYCTDPEMIARFEAVSEPEERPAQRFDADDDDDDELRYPDEREEDDDDYSVFDEEDTCEHPDDEWK